MLKKLRYKFTITCTLTTAFVLLITLFLLASISQKEQRANLQYALENERNTLVFYLQNSYSPISKQHSISHSWLSELETLNDSIIYIEEKHTPLSFHSTYMSKTPTDELIGLARQTALKNYHYNFYSYASRQALSPNSLFFKLQPSSDETYLVCVTSFIAPHTNYQLILLKDISSVERFFVYQILFFIIIFFVSVLAISLISFWFSGHFIFPIEENERKQKEFISAASHELRAPLAVLTTNSSALASEHPTITDSFFYHSIQEECRHMSRLISDLILLSHADTGSHWQLALKETHLDTLLLNVYDRFTLMAHNKKHHLKLELPDEGLPACLIDAERITQALSILIDNALCYTPEGSTISLSVVLQDAHTFCLSVVDDGPGIEALHHTRVFERFYRIDPSRHQKDHSGLGLSIASELITLHNGKILLENTLPHGCTFKILLPYQKH